MNWIYIYIFYKENIDILVFDLNIFIYRENLFSRQVQIIILRFGKHDKWSSDRWGNNYYFIARWIAIRPWNELQVYKAISKSDEDLTCSMTMTNLHRAILRVAKGKKLEIMMKILKTEENNYTKEFLEFWLVNGVNYVQ